MSEPKLPETLADGPSAGLPPSAEPSVDHAHTVEGALGDSRTVHSGGETEVQSDAGADETIASARLPGGKPGVPARAGDLLISGYEIEGVVGRGGMGVVYKARRVQLNRTVALKMIRGGSHAGDLATARFLAEAEAVAQLQHPNIVQIYHIAEHEGCPYLEMEFVGGGSLADALDGAPRPPRDAARLVEMLARAMAEAHRLGIVHRDLKPANVLMAVDGTPKVADFGLAKQIDSDSGLTQHDSVLGSPSYMAPEQAEGRTKNVGPAADIYSLGAIYYEVLTGRPPFRGATVIETLDQVRSTEPVAPSRLVPGVPRDAETIALTCLRKDPSRRYASAEMLAEDLRRFVAGEPITARPVGSLERLVRWCRRNPVVASSVALAAGMLVAVAVVSSAAYVRTSHALAGEQAARREGSISLYHAYLGEARALRVAREAGYRNRVLDLIARAGQLAVPPRDPEELRLEASRCLGDFVGLDPLVLREAGGAAGSVAIHPRSRWVAASGTDGRLRLFDRTSGRELGRFNDPGGGINSVTFADDGRRVLAVRGYETIQAVATPDDGPPRAASEPTRWPGVGKVVAQAGGRAQVLSVDRDRRSLLVGDLEQGPQTARSVTYTGAPQRASISTDGRLVALLTAGAKLQLREVAGDRLVREIALNLPSYMTGFSPDGGLVAVGLDGGFTAYSTADLTPRLSVRLDSALSVRFSPRGDALAVGTITGRVQIWGLTTNRLQAELSYPGQTEVRDVVFSEDGRTLAAVCERAIFLWDLAGALERRTLAGHTGGVTAVAFSPDGSKLASVSNDGWLKVWDGADGRLIRSLGRYPADVQACAFVADGSLLVTGSKENARLRFWDTSRWELLKDLPRPSTGDVDFIAAGRGPGVGAGLLAETGAGCRLWYVSRGTDASIELRPVTTQSGTGNFSVALSPGVERVAFADGARSIKVWERATGRLLPFSGPGLINGWHALGFRSDRELAYAAADGAGVVWDVVANRLVRNAGGSGTFEACNTAVSPDGRWLAGATNPSRLGIANLDRGALVYAFSEERSPIWSLAWSPDSRRVAVGLSDGGVSIWDLDRVRSSLARARLAPE